MPRSRIIDDFSWQAVSAGLLAAFVGFAGSFAIVVQGLRAMGADAGAAASGLMAAGVSMGLCGVFLSLKTRMPVSAAWSTPGAAFLATAAPLAGGFNEAVGAFIIAALLIIASGLWKPLGRAIAAIPAPLASAMLAGILLPICIAPFEAAMELPSLALPILLVWAVVARLWRMWAVPAAVVAAGIVIAVRFDRGALQFASVWASPRMFAPIFTAAGFAGIALPLFVITMASQNIAGIATLRSFGYRPQPGALFAQSGAFGLAAAPFGGHAVNLAAITTALCAGEDAHPDPARRYWASVAAGVGCIVFGLCAGAVVAFMRIAPPLLIEALAGLALFGALGGALLAAMSAPRGREAALITFLITASGVSFFGISGAFWGLLAGGAMYACASWKSA
ncbi:MAG: benzoate/H(+) symporter BenE family transporter [Gammaproteobacteria bacterium]